MALAREAGQRKQGAGGRVEYRAVHRQGGREYATRKGAVGGGTGIHQSDSRRACRQAGEVDETHRIPLRVSTLRVAPGSPPCAAGGYSHGVGRDRSTAQAGIA